ncbi:hypothetical protein BG015_007609 [Linnemannia schmuckeri]|uniref:Uncharacterized protein n=1 Tax=Linnemannia schmuckeri TaxID=64567 RepID=A0A9P5RY83_9FUNG|nr:hypothetical protein BG015_007609 [Linnemannia schmuckeri]
MRQELPDPSSPFNEASDLDDLVSYESEDLHDYPSDSDLPSYTTDIDHHYDDDDSDLALSSFSSSPRHDNESTVTGAVPVAAEDSALLTLASLQVDQGPHLLPDQSNSLAFAEDLTTPDSDSTQQVQSGHSASDIDGSNKNNQPAQDSKDDKSDGDEHDFMLIEERDAIADVSYIADSSDSTDSQQHQQDQHGPESIPEIVNENATSLDAAPDVAAACQESRSTSLQDSSAGHQSTTRTVQLHTDVAASKEAMSLPTPSSASASASALASHLVAASTRVHQPHTEAAIPGLTTLESTEFTGDHRIFRIKVTGRELTDDTSTRIQEKITTNFILQHKYQHTSGIPRPHFVTELADSAAAGGAQNENESTDLCVYVLPASGPTRHDAQNLLQFAQALLPILVLVSTEEYLDPFATINLRQQLATHLRQPILRRADSTFSQQVHVILQSCFTMQDLLSIHIQHLVDGSTPVQASMLDPICEKWNVVKGFMNQGLYMDLVWGIKLQDHLTTGVGVFFMALTVMLAVLVGTNMGSGTFSQPSHAIIRQIDYVQNGRMGVAHVDFLTAKGTPYKGKHQHPFHIRILGDDKAWSVRGAPIESTPDVGDPIVQDLGNGTFKIYVALLRKRHPRGAFADVPLSSWLCPTKTQHFLHIWFANGTKVPLTPRELVWPKRVVVSPAGRIKSGKDTKSSHCSGVGVHSGNCKFGWRNTKATSNPTHTSLDKLDDFEDDEDDDANQTWKDQLQRLSAPMVKHLSNNTVKWMGQQWGFLQPVLCDVHDMTNTALSYTLHSAKRLFVKLSTWVDQLFSRQDYLATHSWDILARAHQGAHQLKNRFFERCSKGKQHKKERKEQKDMIVLLDEQFQSFKRSGQAAAEAAKFPTAEKVLQKMDDLMVEVEDQVEKLLKSKRVQAMAERMNAEELLRRADRVLADAEDRMEKVWKTEKVQDVHLKVVKKVEEVFQTQFAQDVNKRVAKVIKSKMVQDAGDRIQRKVEHLAATPAGKKWIHRMEAHHRQRKEEEAKRPWGWFHKRHQRAAKP